MAHRDTKIAKKSAAILQPKYFVCQHAHIYIYICVCVCIYVMRTEKELKICGAVKEFDL